MYVVPVPPELFADNTVSGLGTAILLSSLLVIAGWLALDMYLSKSRRFRARTPTLILCGVLLLGTVVGGLALRSIGEQNAKDAQLAWVAAEAPDLSLQVQYTMGEAEMAQMLYNSAVLNSPDQKISVVVSSEMKVTNYPTEWDAENSQIIVHLDRATEEAYDPFESESPAPTP